MPDLYTHTRDNGASQEMRKHTNAQEEIRSLNLSIDVFMTPR